MKEDIEGVYLPFQSHVLFLAFSRPATATLRITCLFHSKQTTNNMMPFFKPLIPTLQAMGRGDESLPQKYALDSNRL